MTVPHQPRDMNSSMTSGDPLQGNGLYRHQIYVPELAGSPSWHLQWIIELKYMHSELICGRGDNYTYAQVAYGHNIEIEALPQLKKACCCY